jgi:DNA-binding CsgD family transcriptional regulator
MSVSEADYTKTLDLILQASVEPDAWIGVLRQMAALTNCVAGGLTIENAQTRQGAPMAYFGFDPDHVAKTFDHFLPMNPLFNIAPLMKPGFIVFNQDVIAPRDFEHSDFYNGWSLPQGLGGALTLVLHREKFDYCPLTLVRADRTGEATEADRALLQRLAPHLMRAMRVSMEIEAVRAKSIASEAALQRMGVAVLLLDRERKVVFANSAAERLIGAGTALKTVKAVLTARSSLDDRKLRDAFAKISGTLAAEGCEIKIEREKGRPLLLTMLPIRHDGAFSPFATRVACCSVFIGDPDASLTTLSGMVARCYDLTPTETRLLNAILSGAALSEAAKDLQILVATARTHLRHIFDKTGVRRQSDLINLVMRSGTPLWQDQ